ncbi:MAG: hypothetical protein HZB65_03020 [Candidatus Aenigmarchaeota archaeon]|nr:hypothetical protein [Candidatus Aenigmarchaeota archaeon]
MDQSHANRYSGDELCSIASGFVREHAVKIGPYAEDEFQRRFENIEKRTNEIQDYIFRTMEEIRKNSPVELSPTMLNMAMQSDKYMKTTLEIGEQLRILANDYNAFVLPFQDPEIYKWLKDNLIGKEIDSIRKRIGGFMYNSIRKSMDKHGGADRFYFKEYLLTIFMECKQQLRIFSNIDTMSDEEKYRALENEQRLCSILHRISNSMQEIKNRYSHKYGSAFMGYKIIVKYFKDHIKPVKFLKKLKSLADFTEQDWNDMLNPERTFLSPINNIFED